MSALLPHKGFWMWKDNKHFLCCVACMSVCVWVGHHTEEWKHVGETGGQGEQLLSSLQCRFHSFYSTFVDLNHPGSDKITRLCLFKLWTILLTTHIQTQTSFSHLCVQMCTTSGTGMMCFDKPIVVCLLWAPADSSRGQCVCVCVRVCVCLCLTE